MSEPIAEQDFQLVPLEAVVSGGPVAAARRFNPWLVAALLVHASILGGFMSAKPRQIGDANGADGAISVSLVSDAELRGDSTVADRAAGDVPPPPPQPVQQPAPEPEPVPPQEKVQPAENPPEQTQAARQPEPAPQPELDLKPALTPEPQQEPPVPSKEGETKAAAPPEKEKAEKKEAPAEPPKPHPKPQEAKPSPPKTKETKTAKLDLSVPQPSLDVPTGSRGAGIERPAGITRSGENDAFARNVIRALQQTMPQLRDTHGRVRVRITLNKNGNLVSTQVLIPSNIAGLDQSVVFATKQTYFPLPPNNATSADLVFVVTYIYR